MKRLVRKFGRYNVLAFVMMGVGLALFLLTPLLLWLFEFDSDILGALVFLVGLIMWVGGLIARKVRRGEQAR